MLRKLCNNVQPGSPVFGTLAYSMIQKRCCSQTQHLGLRLDGMMQGFTICVYEFHPDGPKMKTDLNQIWGTNQIKKRSQPFNYFVNRYSFL